MSTITLKINEHSKAGKAFLQMLEVLVKDSKGIELVATESNTTVAEESEIYNPEFVAEILKRSKNINKKTLTHLNPDDVWGSIL